MAPNQEIQTLFGQFKEAYQRLKEAIALKEETEIKQDAVIKRFEFTYELLWKTVKRIAREERIDCFGPKDCFRVAFRLGLIDDEGLFLEIIDSRNKTAHVYSKEEARKIYAFVKAKVITAFDKIQEKIGDFIK